MNQLQLGAEDYIAVGCLINDLQKISFAQSKRLMIKQFLKQQLTSLEAISARSTLLIFSRLDLEYLDHKTLDQVHVFGAQF